MRCEVRVSDGSRFELERDKPPEVGELLDQFSMVYEVVRILPGEGDFDAVVEVRWQVGPAEAQYVP